MLMVFILIHDKLPPFYPWTHHPALQALSRLITNLATAAAEVWEQTKKRSEFIGGPEHQYASDQIKQLITDPTAL